MVTASGSKSPDEPPSWRERFVLALPGLVIALPLIVFVVLMKACRH